MVPIERDGVAIRFSDRALNPATRRIASVNTVLAEESDALGHVIATMTMVEDPEPSAGAPAALPQHAAGRTDRPMPKRSFPWERPAELLIDTGVFQS